MCFSASWIESLLINLVILGAIFAIIRLLVPAALAYLGGPGTLLAQVINIILWAAVLIYIIYIAFALLACLGGFSLFPHR